MTTESNKKFIIHKLINGEYAGGGGGGVDFSQPVEQSLILDVDDTEALLVRKDGDTGDVLAVDTTNCQVLIGDGTETTPSLGFITDTDTGIYKSSDGLNLVKDGTAKVQIKDNAVQLGGLNGVACSQEYHVGAVNCLEQPDLGNVLALYNYDYDILVSSVPTFQMQTAVNMTNDKIVSTFEGRKNVIRVDRANDGVTTRGIYTENATDIASIQGLTDFYVSFWWWGLDSSNNPFFSFHDSATGFFAANNSISFKHVPDARSNAVEIQYKVGGSVVHTSGTINNLKSDDAWKHYVVSFSTTTGIKLYVNKALAYEDNSASALFSLSSITITRFTLGGDDGLWATRNSPPNYFDTFVLVDGVVNDSRVNSLFNDNLGLIPTTLLAQYNYDTDIFTSDVPTFNLETAIELSDGFIVSSAFGRTNVLRVDRNVGMPTVRGIYTDNVSDISLIQNLDDFFISFWWYDTCSSGTICSWHDSLVGLSSANNSLRVYHNGNTRVFIELKVNGVVTYTSSIINLKVASSWAHSVIQFSSTNGITAYRDNVLFFTDASAAAQFSLSSIPITRMVLGGDDNLWSSETVTINYFDAFLMVSGTATSDVRTSLFNDTLTDVAGVVVDNIARIRWDDRDKKAKLELLPSNTSVYEVNDIQMEVLKPLKLTGGAEGDITFNDSDLITPETQGFYQFEDLTDRSENERTLSIVSGAPTLVSSFQGKVNVAFFDANEYYGSDDLASGCNDTDISISLWFNNNDASQRGLLLLYDDGLSGYVLDVVLKTNGAVLVEVYKTNPTKIAALESTTTGLKDGSWHHLIITLGASGTTMYIDGVQETLIENTGTASTDTQPTSPNKFFIGTGFTNFYRDYLTRFYVFSRVLTSTEALRIFNGTTITANRITAPEFATQHFIVKDGNEASDSILTCRGTGGDAFWNPLEETSDGLEAHTGATLPGGTQNANIFFTKIGRTITVLVQGLTWTGTGSSSAVIAGAVVPTAYNPAYDLCWPIRVQNNGTFQTGLMLLNRTTRDLEFYATIGSGSFTGSGSNEICATSATWSI